MLRNKHVQVHTIKTSISESTYNKYVQVHTLNRFIYTRFFRISSSIQSKLCAAGFLSTTVYELYILNDCEQTTSVKASNNKFQVKITNFYIPSSMRSVCSLHYFRIFLKSTTFEYHSHSKRNET